MTDPMTTMPPPGATGAPTGPGGEEGATGAAGEQVQQVKEQAKEQVQQVAGQAKEQARNLADQARTQVDDRSTQAGQKANEHATDLRSVAQHLRAEGRDQPAKLAEQAAEKVERAGSWLTESDADKILGDVEDFGRQRPWAVIGAGVALGVAASRMLKASSTQRYEGSGAMTTSTPRGLPQATGLQGAAVPPAVAHEAPTTTPRTGEGTWGGPGNGTSV